jgi:PAS domain S-box-containing protein
MGGTLRRAARGVSGKASGATAGCVWSAGSGDLTGALLRHGAVRALVVDPEGRIVAHSPALARALGPGIALAPGTALADLLAQPSAARFRDAMLPRLHGCGTVEDEEIDFQRPDGTRVPMLLSALCECDAAGTPLRCVAILTDLSETRAALAAADRQAAELAEAALGKTRFLAAMSHEIRTPMNAILGFAQLLETSGLTEAQRGHVKAILSAGGSLMSLLTDLLDLGQAEEGQLRVEPRDFDVHALVEESIGWWRAMADGKGLRLAAEMGADVPQRILSDPVRIQQVISNYLGNAVKFTQEGHVTLSADLRGAPGASRLRFAVADTGPGISEHELERLYRPFVRLTAEAASDTPGWGLGLSICANIADAMGAEVGVETAPGEGSVFWFEVPFDSVEGGAEAAAPPPETGAEIAPLRVLVAEDDPPSQQIMLQMLREMGHDAQIAANGFEVQEMLAAGPFDVVLMDVMMPGLGGLAATERLRAAGHALPVIGCSAHVSEDSEARARAAGMTGFLPKPVARAALRDALAAAACAPLPAGGAP